MESRDRWREASGTGPAQGQAQGEGEDQAKGKGSSEGGSEAEGASPAKTEVTGAEASEPSPDASPPGPVPFETTFGKSCLVVGNLTALIVFVRELVQFTAEGERAGWHDAFLWFLVIVTVKIAVAVVINCFAVALPIAGVIHYFRYLARRR